MEYKSLPSEMKFINEREVAGVPSVFGNVDSGGDRVFPGSFRKTLKESAQRVKHLWQHDYSNPPVAVVKDIHEAKRQDLEEFFPDGMSDEIAGGLIVVREYIKTARADEIFEGIRSKAITEMSFAYDPVKFDFEEMSLGENERPGLVRNLRELRLWETSDVLWGMNALTVASKSAVPYKDTGKADEGDSWSAPGLGDFSTEMWEDLPSSEQRRIANHYAFSVNWPPEGFSDLKLPHHRAGTGGVGPAIWRGVAAAMAALLGARGGVKLPDSDRRAVYDHLASHYKQFDKEVPDFKLVELASIVCDSKPDELKAGRVLSSRNLQKLKDALAVLSEILENAEPVEEDEDLEEGEKLVSPEAATALFRKLNSIELEYRLRMAEYGKRFTGAEPS